MKRSEANEIIAYTMNACEEFKLAIAAFCILHSRRLAETG